MPLSAIGSKTGLGRVRPLLAGIRQSFSLSVARYLGEPSFRPN
jgi:hypothetical protein